MIRARVNLAYFVHQISAKANTVLKRPAPTIPTIAMAKIVSGKASNPLIILLKKDSTLSLDKPAIKPTIIPIKTIKNNIKKVKPKEVFAPQRIRLKTSLPNLSVPKICKKLGGCKEKS